MTRQKKEIIRKINEIDREIQIDRELGCGYAPIGFYDRLYDEIYKLQDELARLRGYENAWSEQEAEIDRVIEEQFAELPF